MAFAALCAFISVGLCWGQTAPSTSPAAANAERGPLRVVMFYSVTCPGCQDAIDALHDQESRWGEHVQIESRRLVDQEDWREYFIYDEHYGVADDVQLKVYVGGQYMAGSEAIVERLGDIIAEELEKGSVTFVPPSPPKPAGDGKGAGASPLPVEIEQKFQSLRVGALVLAALVDGVNPCAFTTIVFLLSMLTYLGKSRRQLAVVGAGFTSTVFVTYFLLGLGAFGAIKIFSVSHGIATGLTITVACLTFALAAWSLVDFIRYVRSGDAKAMTLGLPKSIKLRIHKVIRVGLTTRSLLAGSITVGFAVSLLEALCTGQVYLPTIVMVVRSPGLRADAIAYLLLYNVIFILPLVVILIIAYLGVKSDRLARFLTRHLAALKLALALLFTALGILVLTTI